jgi:MSHA pilin protein MshB
MNKYQGFTLIELIVVIVILSVLAVTALPKFINFSDSALQAKVEANASALRSGVKLANLKWRAAGSPQAFSQRDNIQLYGSSIFGQIDINPQGFPAQSYPGSDVIISTDNEDDCLSLWQALIGNGNINAAVDNSTEFIVNYENNNTCSYKLTENINFGFIYNAVTGKVTIL